MFKLAVFTDEVSQDFQTAVNVAEEYNLEGLEIRSVWDNPPQSIPQDDIAKMKAILSETNLKVCCIASPFFKCDIDSEAEQKEHLEILRSCIKLAQTFDCSIIRGFTFWRKGLAEDRWQEILDKFEEPIKILASEGATLAIENEASTFIGTGRVLIELLTELNSPQVRAIWDPANSLFDEDVAETPYPDGYEVIKSEIIHVHLKDADTNPETGNLDCTPIGDGAIDFKGQFQALKDDGYSGYASLETHWRPTQLSEEELNRPGGAKFSESGEYASRLCLDNLKKILASVT